MPVYTHQDIIFFWEVWGGAADSSKFRYWINKLAKTLVFTIERFNGTRDLMGSRSNITRFLQSKPLHNRGSNAEKNI
jgi:hypothetical protein